MPFTNKDLALNVLPHLAFDPDKLAKFCAFRTFICRWPTLCAHTCPRIISDCGRCSLLLTEGPGGCHFGLSCPTRSVCDPSIQPCYVSEPFVIQYKEDLVALRAELTHTLAQLAAMEKEGLASGITSAAQADQLEQQLKEQLEMVRKARAGLK